MSSLIASPVQVHLEENSDSSFCGTRSHPASIQRKAFPFQHLLPVLKAAMYSSRSSTGHRYFCLGALRYLVSCHFSPLPCYNRFSAKTNTSDIILPPPLLFLFFFFFIPGQNQDDFERGNTRLHTTKQFLAWHTFPSHRKVTNLTPPRLQVKVE